MPTRLPLLVELEAFLRIKKCAQAADLVEKVHASMLACPTRLLKCVQSRTLTHVFIALNKKDTLQHPIYTQIAYYHIVASENCVVSFAADASAKLPATTYVLRTRVSKDSASEDDGLGRAQGIQATSVASIRGTTSLTNFLRVIVCT